MWVFDVPRNIVTIRNVSCSRTAGDQIGSSSSHFSRRYVLDSLFSINLGHFPVGSYRYRSRIEGLYTLYRSLIEALYTLNSPPVVAFKLRL